MLSRSDYNDHKPSGFWYAALTVCFSFSAFINIMKMVNSVIERMEIALVITPVPFFISRE